MAKQYIIDTNILLEQPDTLNKYQCVILSHIIRELEKHKISKNSELAYQARNATRYIEANIDMVSFDFKDYQVSFDLSADGQYVDNKIIQACLNNGYGIITRDLLLKHKAKGYDIEVVESTEEDDDDEYSGYLKVKLNDEELATLYEKPNKNTYNLLINQYLIVEDLLGEVVEITKWDGNEIKLVQQKGFSTNMFGKFKPFDPYQACALDSLSTNQMTMIKGKAGSGKSLIALNYAWSQIERGKFDKLIIFSNPIASKHSSRLGFYPGSRTEKLLDSSVGSMLTSKFGDYIQVEALINSGKILLLPFADIRGFDTTGMKAIVWFVESQNLDVELIRLGIQRIGEDSKAILDGDFLGQVDMSAYEGMNNGMRRVSTVFRGRESYGEIMLPIIYRSKLAEIADLL